MKKYEVTYRRRPIDPVSRIIVNANDAVQAKEIVKTRFSSARELKIIAAVEK